METYAGVLLYAIPIFTGLILVEQIYGILKGDNTFRAMDTISSLSSGLTNILKDVLGLSVAVISYSFLYKHLALFSLGENSWVFVLSFIAIDFAGYWNHRLAHSVNYFWNDHIIHHSSEEFNLACALRQSISNLISVYSLFLLPAAFIGIPPKVIAVIGPIHLFLQFWYHTRHIKKMGFLEYIIVTPSIHRVHHAINKEYLDKNLGQIFSFWDRLFGTFQEELPEVPCVYGVKRPVKTWNPFLINFQHLWQLIQDAWHAKNWWDKLRIWLMPLGWRPADVAEKYPVQTINDPNSQEKYDPRVSNWIKAWSWVQLIVCLLFIFHLFSQFAAIGFPGVAIYSAFLFASVFAYTTFMDGNPHAIWMEILRCLAGLGIIWESGDWFGINSLFPGGFLLPLTFFIISATVVTVIGLRELVWKKEESVSYS